MSINLPNVKGTSEKRIIKSHKIISMFYSESNSRKLLYKPKDKVAIEDRKNIPSGNVYLGEYKRSLKSPSDGHKRPTRN